MNSGIVPTRTRGTRIRLFSHIIIIHRCAGATPSRPSPSMIALELARSEVHFELVDSLRKLNSSGSRSDSIKTTARDISSTMPPEGANNPSLACECHPLRCNKQQTLECKSRGIPKENRCAHKSYYAQQKQFATVCGSLKFGSD